MRRQERSLKSFFRRQAIKWSLLSLVLILIFAIPGFIFILKTASEKRLETMARAAAYAFRPRIIQGQIREVQPQIATALKLADHESVVIRDEKLNPVYFDGTEYPKTSCSPGESACWIHQFGQLERLEPIFFDEGAGKIFGYVDLTVQPVYDRRWLFAFFLLIPIIFVIQSIGLMSVLSDAADQMTGKLHEWASRIKNPQSRSMVASIPPFQEFQDLQDGITDLNAQIERLTSDVAQESKTSAQVAILREIGHDLKTPLSQLAKYWALHIDTVDSLGKADPAEVKNVERTLSRMGAIIRQVRAAYLRENVNEPIGVYDPVGHTKTIIEDLRTALEMDALKLRYRSPETPIAAICVTPTEFYQLVENLVRNGLEALNGDDHAFVEVSFKMEERNPVLTVCDRGVGISDETRARIFDFDFTTKPAKGTGIGLGIVKRICAEYGAKLSFTSNQTTGTEFQIKFQPLKLKEVSHEAQNLSC